MPTAQSHTLQNSIIANEQPYTSMCDTLHGSGAEQHAVNHVGQIKVV